MYNLVSKRDNVFALLFSICLTSTAAAAPPPPKYLPGFFIGGASVVRADASLGGLSIELNRLSAEGCPCQGTNGRIVSDTTGAATLPGVLALASTQSTAVAKRDSTSASSIVLTRVDKLSLFGGLISSRMLRAEARTVSTEQSLSTSTQGSVISGLVIAGQAIPADVAPNTTLNVAGLGTVTINAITTSGDGKTAATIEVDMLDIVLDPANTFGLPAGATIRIASAQAGYSRKQPNVVVSGAAFVTDANVTAGTVLLTDLGQMGGAGIGSCYGTEGVTHTTTTAAVSTAIGTIGAGSSSAFGGPTGPGTTVAETAAMVGNIALLGGLIEAKTITAVAAETAVSGKISASTAGSGFSGLVVAGLRIPLSTPANTVLQLPGIGYITLNEQALPAGQQHLTSVNGMHIHISSPNLLGVPVGSEIIVAHADATAVPLSQ